MKIAFPILSLFWQDLFNLAYTMFVFKPLGSFYSLYLIYLVFAEWGYIYLFGFFCDSLLYLKEEFHCVCSLLRIDEYIII